MKSGAKRNKEKEEGRGQACAAFKIQTGWSVWEAPIVGTQAPHRFAGLNKEPYIQASEAAPESSVSVTESTYFSMFLTFILAVLTQERRRGSAWCSVMSSLFTCQEQKALTGSVMEKPVVYGVVVGTCNESTFLPLTAFKIGVISSFHSRLHTVKTQSLTTYFCLLFSEYLRETAKLQYK